jgi:hypothetical protein
MKENEKYYTPEIEEFHVGFEYEMLFPNGHYYMQNFGEPIKHLQLQEYPDDLMKIAHAITRVKHLDREDIESLEFEFDNNYSEIVNEERTMVFSKKVKHRGEDKILMMIYNTSSKWMLISVNSKEGASYLMESKTNQVGIPIITIETNNTLFAGITKNKSELNKVLKLVVYNEKS